MKEIVTITVEHDVVDTLDGDSHKTVTVITNECQREELVDTFKSLLEVIGYKFPEEEE